MGIINIVLKQWRKPTGRGGRFLVRAMNVSHSMLTDWGLKHVLIDKQYTILDIGCGGGGTVHKLAGIAIEGKVYGVDLSEDSVAVSRRTNKQFIEMGRVQIQNSSVSCLPFSQDMFDLVTAVNTHYYWPNLFTDLKEILRVLKLGGKLMILGDAYKGSKHCERNRRFLEEVGDAEYYSVGELNELLSNAGYSDVHILEKHERDFICAIGTKSLCSSHA
jgi:ubiquinone/menaquinone biosynthesis C-methylase UbiE